MKIERYHEGFRDSVTKLLIELEEYLMSIDEDGLDRVGPAYREQMLSHDLNELSQNEGICYVAVENGQAIGTIMGKMRRYEPFDWYDYSCPKTGEIMELIVTKEAKGRGIGKELMREMEKYFKEKGCKYISIEVFAYNYIARSFYADLGFHERMLHIIKPVIL